jgi:exopolyphosphatase/guanosine-5'-triphosphate,3'-diphosphate pyrophosphatase
MKLAALDLGSNSFHVLVARVAGAQELTKLGSRKEILGLGTIVQERGHLSAAGFDHAFASVARLSGFARELGAEKLMGVGTSALRDARNSHVLLQACRERLGVEIELLSGEDEARLAYVGATRGLTGLHGPSLVVDIGGGSVEVAAGEGSRCDAVHSLPLGFLRMARAFPLREGGGARRLARYVQLESEKLRARLTGFGTLVLSGGTARAIAKLLDSSSPVSRAKEVISVCSMLAEMKPEQLRRLGVSPERAPNLAAGSAVVSGVLSAMAVREVCISRWGLREGVLLREVTSRAHAA